MSGSTDKLLGKDYWLIRSLPAETTTADDLTPLVDEHVSWLLGLEREGLVVLSGPLLDGPGARPGSGITVLRADDAEHAARLAGGDPFVVAGLRSFEVCRWRVNEGSIGVRLSLGTGTFHWE
ncbi:YciI family protein [Amycolatopsis pithecellobii]|nr:YciI family protein [Amycolatopsis pithecellobii]